MKKVLFTALLATVVSLGASAQTRIGGMLGFGSEIETLGIGALGEFMIKDNMGISPQLFFFFPKDDVSWFEVNANFNYYFMQDQVDLYGLAGLNIATVKVDRGPLEDYSDTEIGINLGLGLNFHLSNDNIKPFAELKYVIGDADQLAIFAGVKFLLP
jgi:outer membrane protein X